MGFPGEHLQQAQPEVRQPPMPHLYQMRSKGLL